MQIMLKRCIWNGCIICNQRQIEYGHQYILDMSSKASTGYDKRLVFINIMYTKGLALAATRLSTDALLHSLSCAFSKHFLSRYHISIWLKQSCTFLQNLSPN